MILHVIGVCRPVKITRSARMSPRPDLTSASWPWSDAVRGPGRRIARRRSASAGRSAPSRRPPPSPVSGTSCSATAGPGVRVMAIFLGGLGVLALVALSLGRAGLLRSLVSPGVLVSVTVACVLIMIAWMAVIMWTFVATDPRTRSTRDQVIGASVAAALCVGVAIPLGATAELANTQRTLLDQVFSPGPAPAATGGPAAAGPVLPPRLNVLLVGSDAGPDRTGARTDTMMRRQHGHHDRAAPRCSPCPATSSYAPFPPGSPMARGSRTASTTAASPLSGDYLLNAVYAYGHDAPRSWPPPARPPTPG